MDALITRLNPIEPGSLVTHILTISWEGHIYHLLALDDPRYVVKMTRQSPFVAVRSSASSTNKATHSNKSNHHELYGQSRCTSLSLALIIATSNVSADGCVPLPWGADDQIGAANRVSPKRTVAAV